MTRFEKSQETTITRFLRFTGWGGVIRNYQILNYCIRGNDGNTIRNCHSREIQLYVQNKHNMKFK